jgi:hypothetical protein
MPAAKLGISFPIELVEEIDRMSKGLKKPEARL